MTSWKSTATSAVVLSIFMTGSAAFADVTADQVWADWRDYMSGFGYQVEASENRSGDTLTISGLAMSIDIPEEDTAVTVTMDEVSFTDNGDGTVSVTLPPVTPIKANIDADGENVDVLVDYVTKGFSMVVSGDASEMTYSYTAAEAAVRLAELVVEGQPVDLGNFDINMANITGSTIMKIGELRSTSQKMSTGAVTYNVDFADPEGSGRIVMKGGVDSMEFGGAGSIPANMDPTNMAAMMEAGFAFDGSFSYKNGASEFNFQEDGEVVQGSSSSEGGSLSVAMDADKLHYSGKATNSQMALAGGDIPLPIELAMQRSGFNLTMPISPSEQEQDFAFGFELGDFTMSDLLWGIFDPAEQLPRDPATIAIDLTGKAKLFFNLMDPEQMEAVDSGEEVPGELNELNLNSLTVRAAGAELTGDGAFTFDNSDLETFDGMPAPTGAVDLKLVGGNGLLDKLIAMGLVPEDQAMGMRMMMGLFAVPGEGEDTLTSKIEVTGDGQVLANGQRLK